MTFRLARMAIGDDKMAAAAEEVVAPDKSWLAQTDAICLLFETHPDERLVKPYADTVGHCVQLAIPLCSFLDPGRIAYSNVVQQCWNLFCAHPTWTGCLVSISRGGDGGDDDDATTSHPIDFLAIPISHVLGYDKPWPISVLAMLALHGNACLFGIDAVHTAFCLASTQLLCCIHAPQPSLQFMQAIALVCLAHVWNLSERFLTSFHLSHYQPLFELVLMGTGVIQTKHPLDELQDAAWPPVLAAFMAYWNEETCV